MDVINNLYFGNELFQGFFNLSLIFGTMIVLIHLILGKKRHKNEVVHPQFGRYTKQMPNFLSYLRFPLAIWMFATFYFDSLHKPVFAFSFHLSFALICLFDSLDGQFARKWQAITEDGKSLDPAADKWVTFWLVITAFMFESFYWWALIIIIAREVISIIQRNLLKKKGIDVSARWLGKIKTGVQFTVLYIILLRSNILTGTIFLDKVARVFPENMILWGIILLCFCTIISLFPFFQSFSYVNDYTQSQKEESNKPWYIIIWPNLLTVGNYLCGITAVFFSIPFVAVEHRSFVILFWILAAALCDAFDGPLSRKLESYSEFGACLDSSTDLSTFGLATAIIIFLRFVHIQGGDFSLLGLFLASVYFIFVHLRLARFTLRLNEKTDKSQKGDFLGLPSPSASASVLVLFTFSSNIIFLSIAIIIISLLMYSKIDLISHSNSFKHPFYKYLLIPSLLIGFFMLIALIFQQPFVSTHFSKELKVYFNICSWILFIPVILYLADGIRRTYFVKTI